MTVADRQYTVIQARGAQKNGNVLCVSMRQGRTSPQNGEVRADKQPTGRTL